MTMKMEKMIDGRDLIVDLVDVRFVVVAVVGAGFEVAVSGAAHLSLLWSAPRAMLADDIGIVPAG